MPIIPFDEKITILPRPKIKGLDKINFSGEGWQIPGEKFQTWGYTDACIVMKKFLRELEMDLEEFSITEIATCDYEIDIETNVLLSQGAGKFTIDDYGRTLYIDRSIAISSDIKNAKKILEIVACAIGIMYYNSISLSNIEESNFSKGTIKFEAENMFKRGLTEADYKNLLTKKYDFDINRIDIAYTIPKNIESLKDTDPEIYYFSRALIKKDPQYLAIEKMERENKKILQPNNYDKE